MNNIVKCNFHVEMYELMFFERAKKKERKGILKKKMCVAVVRFGSTARVQLTIYFYKHIKYIEMKTVK